MFWFLFALSSALLSASAAVLQKKVLFRMTALEFSFAVSALILCVSLLVPFVVDVASIPQPTLLFILGKSMLGAFAFLLVMMSLEKNQISSALPLLGLTPAVAALLAVPALGESLRVWEWTAIGMMMAGTYLIEKKPRTAHAAAVHSTLRSPSHGPIIAAVVLFAVSAVSDRMLVGGSKVHPLAVLFYQHIVYCLIFGAMLVVRRRTRPLAHTAQGVREMSVQSFGRLVRAQLPIVAAVAVITIAYRFAQLEATKDAPAAMVLAVKRTSIVFATLYGGRLFSDDRLGMKLAGACLIVGSGFLILRFIA